MTAAEALSVAIAHREAGRLAAARALCGEILKQTPDHAGARHVMGVVARDTGDLPDAIRLIGEAIALDPGNAGFYSSIGTVLLEHGRVDEAVNAYRTAIALDPLDSGVHRKLLAGLLYRCDSDPERRFAEHLAFAARHQPDARRALPAPTNDRAPDRRLRVGFLTSDFWDHPVARNLLPFFRCYDRQAVEIACYAEVARPDAVSGTIRDASALWRSTVGMADSAVAETIRRDAIDILIVLAARFDNNRPLVACYRPAPVQVSMFDGATTALRGIDYCVTDPVMTPPDCPERFGERLAFLPTLVSFPALGDAVRVGPLPALTSRRIAFGSFNNPTKIGPRTVALWSLVLRALPDSSLTLKYRTRYADPSLRTRLYGAFGAEGIDPKRIRFLSAVQDQTRHIESYASVDIALDTTPFTGSNTTFDALSMGVPTITLAGDTMVSRMSTSYLTTIGLPELIARSPDEFVARAVALAGDIDALARLRASLPDRVARSPLCDGASYARSLERLLRGLWREWCAAS